jgi:tRNA dimethylallyltransferase
VWELTGRPLSAWQTQWAGERPVPAARCLYLDRPREELYARIDERVQQMIADGLVEEVRALMALPRPLSREARQALGYKEVLDHLAGKATLAETVARIQTRSRNFAKQQLTWFRHLPSCEPTTEELTFVRWSRTM